MVIPAPQIKRLGNCDYLDVWQNMKRFTAERNSDSDDEIWLLEHNPVFTLGQAGDMQHVLDPGDIPVVSCDRGGQVTYHGPGQIVMYVLLNLRRAGLGVRDLVTLLERTAIDYLAGYDIAAESRRDAPGVYVGGAKIAALGLRISRGFSFHGLSFNVNPDLQPFQRINPCGFERLPVTSLEQIDMLERVLHTTGVTDSVDNIAYNKVDSETAAAQVGDALADVFQTLYLGTQASAACNESVIR